MELIYKLIVCHFIGDYVLQNDFLAKTKGANWWHLITHCFLYSLPFYLALGWTWQLGAIIVSHTFVDTMKARYRKISYVTDQLLHIAVLGLYFIP